MRGSMLVRWLLNTVALLALPYVYAGVAVDGPVPALIAAALLGVANAVVRPVLLVLTLPLNVATLGLFTFVINALLLWLVAALVAGFHLQGFLAALLASLLLSIFSAVLSRLVR